MATYPPQSNARANLVVDQNANALADMSSNQLGMPIPAAGRMVYALPLAPGPQRLKFDAAVATPQWAVIADPSSTVLSPGAGVVVMRMLVALPFEP